MPRQRVIDLEATCKYVTVGHRREILQFYNHWYGYVGIEWKGRGDGVSLISPAHGFTVGKPGVQGAPLPSLQALPHSYLLI
jgi:hypothetical protein